MEKTLVAPLRKRIFFWRTVGVFILAIAAAVVVILMITKASPLLTIGTLAIGLILRWVTGDIIRDKKRAAYNWVSVTIGSVNNATSDIESLIQKMPHAANTVTLWDEIQSLSQVIKADAPKAYGTLTEVLLYLKPLEELDNNQRLLLTSKLLAIQVAVVTEKAHLLEIEGKISRL